MGLSSKSRLRELAKDPRALEIVKDYIPDFDPNEPDVQALMSITAAMAVKFPQSGLTWKQGKELCDRLDALDED